jgi:hypothetical protein
LETRWIRCTQTTPECFGETLDVATIAGRLLLPEWRVDQLIYEAAAELGWALVCAGHDRRSFEKVAA